MEMIILRQNKERKWKRYLKKATKCILYTLINISKLWFSVNFYVYWISTLFIPVFQSLIKIMSSISIIKATLGNMLLLTMYNVECFFVKNRTFQDLCSGKAEAPKEIFYFTVVYSWDLVIEPHSFTFYDPWRLDLLRFSHWGIRVLTRHPILTFCLAFQSSGELMAVGCPAPRIVWNRHLFPSPSFPLYVISLQFQITH